MPTTFEQFFAQNLQTNPTMTLVDLQDLWSASVESASLLEDPKLWCIARPEVYKYVEANNAILLLKVIRETYLAETGNTLSLLEARNLAFEVLKPEKTSAYSKKH